MWTAELQKAWSQPPHKNYEQTRAYGAQWIGRKVTDCSGLPLWALKQLGEEIVHHARYQYTDASKAKGKLINGKREDGKPILPGTAVFLQGSQEHIHHVGVYVGDDTCIEAKGTIYGVVTSPLSRWDHWGELKMVDYSGQDVPVTPSDDVLFQATVTNPNAWLNVRSGPGMQHSLRFQVHRDSTVDVLTQEPEWWQIRYGGQIGWAYAKYLSPIDKPVDEPNVPDIDAGNISLSPDELNELIHITNSLNDLIRKIGGLVG